MLKDITPVPWTVTFCNQGEGCWCRVISCPPDENGHDWIIPSGCVDARDAHLIAAAPDMYEALSDIMENPQFQTAIGGNPNMVDSLMAKAFAALRKARGEP